MAAAPLAACAARMEGAPPPPREYVGGVEQFDPALLQIVDPAARPEVLATGYGWAEGPVGDLRVHQQQEKSQRIIDLL